MNEFLLIIVVVCFCRMPSIFLVGLRMGIGNLVVMWTTPLKNVWTGGWVMP